MTRENKSPVRQPVATFLCVVATGFSLNPALAQEPAVSPELITRMEQEKSARRACKIDICKAFAAPADGAPISCGVTRTWLANEIQTGILGDRLSWPWGHAQCTTTIDLDRKAIATAANNPAASIKLKKHNLSCTLDNKDAKDGTAYNLKISIEPTVTFEKGQATKVEMGWGEIEAPVLVKTALWSSIAVDRGFNVLSSGAVKEINDFLFEKCKFDGVEIAKK
jgi:hypothetical protein